ncbi:Fimbrial assembly [Candidatus Magnetoovum chiemensis]|nr:Fimbrial assembly [Candidatus Magnetoovum chiemensis]
MIRINLLPGPKKRKKPTKEFPVEIISIIGVTIVSIVAALIFNHSLNSKIEKLETDKKNKTAELEELKNKIKEVEELEAKIQKIIENQKIIEELRINQSIPVKVLDQINKVVPENIWLTAMDIANRKISIKGTAFTNAEVVDFVDGLKNMTWLNSEKKMFSEVFLVQSSSSSVKGEDRKPIPIYMFTITMNIAGSSV